MTRIAAADLRLAWVILLSLAAAPMLTASRQPSQAASAAQPSLFDESVAVVNTGLELALAIANPLKTWAFLNTSIQVNDTDWNDVVTPVSRTSNFTITGRQVVSTLWPVLGLGFVKSKIRLENSTALILQYVVVRDFRATPLGQSPGFDIVASSTTDAGAVVVMQDAVLMLRICVPHSLQGEMMSSISRPANFPGAQVSFSNVSQANCANDTAAPVVSSCWPDLGIYQDVAVAGFDIDAFGRATATRYALHMLRVQYLCERQMTDECVNALGPLGCFLYMFPRNPFTAPPPSPPPENTIIEEAKPRSSSHNSTPAIVGGVVGGLAGVVIITLLALLVVRRRHRRAEERRGASYEDSEKMSTASGNPLAPGAGSGNGNANGNAKRQLNGNSPSVSIGGPPSGNAQKGSNGTPPEGSLKHAVGSGRHIVLPSGVGTCVLSSTEVDASSPLVIVTPFTPHRSDLKLDVECDTEVKLLPIIRGKGSYGRVVEGLYGGQRVAVKLVVDVDEWSGPTDSLVSSFAQEVEVLGRCQHPNIVRLLAACLKPPRLCLVMELMDTSLERMVHGRGGELLLLPTVLHIAADIARGLAYLHPTIVHRDLKPGNVLLSNTKSIRPIAKLTDFGLSRLRSTVLVTRHPEAGTPAYMAPEAFDASNYVITHKADIYALGVILWEMLTGSVPWDGCSMVAIAYSITVRHHRLPLSKLDASRCPPKLRKLIHQCWDPDPQRRPAAAELVKQLTLVLQLVQGEQEAPSSTGSFRSNNNASADNTKAAQAAGAVAGGPPGAGAVPVAPAAAAAAAAAIVAAAGPGDNNVGDSGDKQQQLLLAQRQQQQQHLTAGRSGGTGSERERVVAPPMHGSSGAAMVVTGGSSMSSAPGATSLSQVSAGKQVSEDSQEKGRSPQLVDGPRDKANGAPQQPASGACGVHSAGLGMNGGAKPCAAERCERPVLVSQSEL